MPSLWKWTYRDASEEEAKTTTGYSTFLFLLVFDSTPMPQDPFFLYAIVLRSFLVHVDRVQSCIHTHYTFLAHSLYSENSFSIPHAYLVKCYPSIVLFSAAYNHTSFITSLPENTFTWHPTMQLPCWTRR